MSQMVRVASVSEIPAGSGKEVTVQGRVVAVYNIEGQFYALDGICPHAGGPLGEGDVSDSIVTCPWHGWQFDVTTGRHCLSPNIRQATIPVQLDGNDVCVELPD